MRKGSQAKPSDGPKLPSWFLKRLPGTQVTVLLGAAPATIGWLGTRMLLSGRVGREADLVAQAEIDGQVGADLPGVLRVEFVFGIAGIEEEGALGPLVALGDEAAVDLADAAEQEIDVRLEDGRGRRRY